MLTIIAKIHSKPEFKHEVEKALKSLIEPTLLERGCITYTLHKSVDKPNVFMFYEIWVDSDAFKHHMESGHVKVWLEKSPEWLESYELMPFEAIED